MCFSAIPKYGVRAHLLLIIHYYSDAIKAPGCDFKALQGEHAKRSGSTNRQAAGRDRQPNMFDSRSKSFSAPALEKSLKGGMAPYAYLACKCVT